MKVLIAHNRYRSALPSGENEVVEAEIEALEKAGVQVIPYLRSSDEIARMNPKDKFAVPFMPLHSRRALGEIENLLRVHRPDIVHLHNPYPLISLSIVRTAHSYGLPVVQTVHNHRHSCARGSYFRDGHPCFECRGKALPWPAVQHSCYRDSRLQSVAMATALFGHRRDQRAIDRYIALSQSIAQSLEDSGLVSPGQVVVRPNSVPDPGRPGPPGTGLLFVGRLTKEKGISLLLDAWRRSGRPFGTLTVVGDGPDRPMVELASAEPGSGVVFLGPTDRTGVSDAMRSSEVVVVPSTASEALPLVVLEAFAHGRPVLASNVGGLGAVVEPSVGWLSSAHDADLAETLTLAAASDTGALGRAARMLYESTFSPHVVMSQQLGIYRDVIQSCRGDRDRARGREDWSDPGT